MIRRLREHAMIVGDLPVVDLCSDPNDNYLLAMAQAANADYLVTGDKADLLIMDRHLTTRILSARAFAEILGI